VEADNRRIISAHMTSAKSESLKQVDVSVE